MLFNMCTQIGATASQFLISLFSVWETLQINIIDCEKACEKAGEKASEKVKHGKILKKEFLQKVDTSIKDISCSIYSQNVKMMTIFGETSRSEVQQLVLAQKFQ